MKINLNTKKKQKTIKKFTNNSNNNFYKLKTCNNNVINPSLKWSKCNTSIVKYFKKNTFETKDNINKNIFLNNLAIIEKQLKFKQKSYKKETMSTSKIEDNEYLMKEENFLNNIDINISIDPKDNNSSNNNNYINNNINRNSNNNSINCNIDKIKMEQDKKLKKEQCLKKKIQEEENLKKLKKCFSNTPYPTIIDPENKYNICGNDNNDNFYDTIYNTSNNNNNNGNENNTDSNNNNKVEEQITNKDVADDNYNHIIHNIKAPILKNNIKKNYVNQIPNEILIRVFSNSIFNQNDYYKFCLVCRSWNHAATIVLWNKPNIYSFHQLVKFYQCLLYNEKIVNLFNQENSISSSVDTKTSSISLSLTSSIEKENVDEKGEKSFNKSKYINHNLSKLVNKLDLTRVRLERPISTKQRTELYKALNILGDKLMPFINSLSICREQCNSYLFLGTSIINTYEDYSNQPLILSCNNNSYNNDNNDLCFKETSFPSVHHLRFIDLNYKSVTSLLKSLKKFNNIETLYISIALFQSWKEWNNNNHINNYLIFQKVVENLKSPHLKKIRLQNCCDLNDDACYQLFNKCPEINELEILGSSNVTIDVLYYSLKMLKDLKILSYTAISTPQFKLEDNNDNNTDNDNTDKEVKKDLMEIDLLKKPCASNIQIIDINSTGWASYLNWMFNNQCCNSVKKMNLTVQTEEERDTIYKAVSSCKSLEELIITYRHESNENNETPIINEQLSIDLDKLFLAKTEDYQSQIKFLHISGLEIEKSKRLTKYIENIKNGKEKNNNGNDDHDDNDDNEKEDEYTSKLRFNKLKYLHLYLPSSKCPIEYILYQFPCLEEFVLNLSEPIEEEILENEINEQIENQNNEINNDDEISQNINNNNNNNSSNNTNLNDINNNNNYNKWNFFKTIESHLKRLSIRSSSFGDGFTNKQITSIIEKCVSITNLELDCKSLTEDCLCNILEILKGKLVSLRLERVNRSTITDKFLGCLCETNPMIQQLEIFAEHGKLDVTYEGTNQVIEKCKNLKYFSLGLEGFNPIIPSNLEQPSNYRTYFKILNYSSKKRFS